MVFVCNPINTIHFQTNWHKTRKPRLRYEILACLVLNGKRTKGQTESLIKDYIGTHSEIIKAFSKLESDGLIQKLNEWKDGQGNRQWYYKITTDGLAQLIAYDPQPQKFWKALFGYCHHDDKGLTAEKVDAYYDFFMERYLKYKQPSSFRSLVFFDLMCREWFRNTVLENFDLGVEQKVIEVLAIHPGITFEELVNKTAASQYEVNKCLMAYSLESYAHSVRKKMYEGIKWMIQVKKHFDIYWMFLLHSIVVLRQATGTCDRTYELSLFGVMLALAILRHKDKDRLKHNLHYQNISFSDYYERIAHNYKDKLPLIFGKWTLLKDILKLYPAYNFDFILNEHLRSADRCSNRTVIRGGIKELIESFQEIGDQNYDQFSNLFNVGELTELKYSSQEPRKERCHSISKDYMIDNDIAVHSVVDPNKTISLKKKIDEIAILLNPLGRIPHEDIDILKKVSVQFERQFERDITALYYIHLYSTAFDLEFPVSDRYISTIPASSSPKECLSLLIKRDTNKPLLSEWFYNLMDEINNHQKEIQAALPKRGHS